jgi:glycosyltransferase involved in cell wall biosynthesis
MALSSDRRRVLFIIGGQWIAGPVTFLRHACANLPELGWEPLLLLTGPARTDSFDNWPCAVSELKLCHSYSQLAREAAQVIVNHDTDVVVATDDNTTAVAMQELYRQSSCTVRLLEMLHADLPSEFSRVERLVPVTTAACAINDTVVRDLRRQIPALSDRVFRWYNPVPCAAHPPQPRLSSPVNLIYVGRVFQREKRVLDLVDIGKRLLARGFDFRLTIVGDGEVMNELRQRLVASPEVDRKTTLMGWISPEAITELLCAQDLFLLPGDRESMGFALLEAMGQGVVPIVTPLPGPSEVVDQETGYTVPVGDYDAFASAIADAIVDFPRLQRMRRAGYERVRRTFHIPVAIEAFVGILNDTLTLPLPSGRHRFLPPRPLGRMDKLHIPQCLQHAKRRLFGQHITA